jgi:type VI secretion system protein ImpH
MPEPVHPRSPLGRLFTAPGKFDFFQAVALLERLAAGDGRAAVGGDSAPEQEVVHFRVQPALRFAVAPVAKVVPAGDDGVPELTVTFGGLTGPDGILPQHYTSLLLARQRLKDHTLRDWLDLFHHRLLSLLFRAWEKTHWPAVVDRHRGEGRSGNDPTTLAAFAVAGFGTAGLRDRLSLPDDAAVFYAGFLGRRPRPASGLEQILGEYFGWPVAVEQLAGQWLYLDAENRAEMPTLTAPGKNVGLGRDAVIGRRVWDVQSKVRIVVGPVDGTGFRSLLPGGDARGPLSEWVRLYLGPEFDAEVQVVIRPEAVPWAALEYDEANGPRLGLNTWIRSHNFGTPVGDVRFGVG